MYKTEPFKQSSVVLPNPARKIENNVEHVESSTILSNVPIKILINEQKVGLLPHSL